MKLLHRIFRRIFRPRRPWEKFKQRDLFALRSTRLEALRRADNGWVIPGKEVDPEDEEDELVGALYGFFGPREDVMRLTKAGIFNPAAWQAAAEDWFMKIPDISDRDLVTAGIVIGQIALALAEDRLALALVLVRLDQEIAAQPPGQKSRLLSNLN